MIKRGIRGLEEEIAYSRERNCARPERLAYLDQMEITIGHLKYWHRRYLDAIAQKIDQTQGETKRRWEQIHQNLSRVPMEPARNFREAVQSLWFMFVFQRLTGNRAAVDRVDWMLGPCLKKDLAEGTITLDEAREYIAHFRIKGCEWVDTLTCIGHAEGSGDGQFFQNAVLSGQDAQGNDETSEVTHLVLDVLAELRQSVLKLAEPGPSKLPYQSFEELYDAYIRQLKSRYREFSMEKIRFAFCPNIAISLLVENCILNGTDFGYKRGGGAIYEVEAPHAGGLQDAANALQAIRWVVYEQKMMSLNAFMDIERTEMGY